MIRQRVMSAAVIAVLLVGAVLLPRYWSAVALSVVLLAAGIEWSGFVDARWTLRRFTFLATTAMGCVVLWRLSANEAGLRTTLWLALLFWSAVAAWVFLLPHRKHLAAVFISGVLALAFAWIALMRVRLEWTMGREVVLLSLLIVWLADSGAYFAGRAWGVRKLAPLVSPGKTVAGFWGGLVASALVALLFSALLGWDTGLLVATATVVGIYSVVGDLLESLCKRFAGLKDSGTLIPGHGGILDRFDSLLAAAPCLILALALIEGPWR